MTANATRNAGEYQEKKEPSCCAQRLDLLDLCLMIQFRLPQVIGTLGIQPELRGVAEQLGQSQGHHRADGPFFSKDLIDRLTRYPKLLPARPSSAHSPEENPPEASPPDGWA